MRDELNGGEYNLNEGLEKHMWEKMDERDSEGQIDTT